MGLYVMIRCLETIPKTYDFRGGWHVHGAVFQKDSTADTLSHRRIPNIAGVRCWIGLLESIVRKKGLELWVITREFFALWERARKP